ncbi:MAG: GNAT family N-acetyltransferase [Christensenellaceae bacterium]|nr:GNAT family N-acetyltransferase [Christensenellaceae bacterium]
MQAAFPTGDERTFALLRGLPGAHGMVEAARHGMGRAWADSPIHPRAAVVAVGDFLYCGGQAGPSAAHLLRAAVGSEKRGWLVFAPGAWKDALDRVAPNKPETRYAFDHTIQPEDSHLRRLLEKAPDGLTFQRITGEWIARCRQAEWSRDFVSLFTDEQFEKDGLGVLAMLDGEPVAGASSYVAYPGGVEVQVQTRDDCQGRGLATLAAAKLILTAHGQGRIATWDAANSISKHLAEKLGYRYIGEYTVYEVTHENRDL